MLTEALVSGFVHTFLRVGLCARVNLRVVTDPLRASLASFAYTANTASWYSVRELRCCNTNEVSLPSTTAWGAGVWGGEGLRWIEEKGKLGVEMDGRWGREGVSGQRMAGKMVSGAINEGGWKWQMEERNERERQSRKERMVEEGENTIDLLNEIKYKRLKQNNIFHSDLNGWQLWYRLGPGWASWKGVLTYDSRPSGPCKPR